MAEPAFLRIAIFDAGTGDILRMVTCPRDSIEAQLDDGEAWIECDDLSIDDSTHHVSGGEIVAR